MKNLLKRSILPNCSVNIGLKNYKSHFDLERKCFTSFSIQNNAHIDFIYLNTKSE